MWEGKTLPHPPRDSRTSGPYEALGATRLDGCVEIGCFAASTTVMDQHPCLEKVGTYALGNEYPDILCLL